MHKESGIDTLLELDQQILDQGNGYWIKIEARRVTSTQEIPHGIRYSLTLHEPYGKRILGYDNAHAVKPPKKFKFAGQRYPMTTSTGILATKACLMNFKMRINF